MSAPPLVVDHLKASQALLHAQGHVNVELLGSFPLYMTGLKYHQVPPVQNQVYMCRPEKGNKFDHNAVGIYAGVDRIAYMPKVLTAHIQHIFRSHAAESFSVICFCSGRPSEASCQCIYNVYGVYQSQLPTQSSEFGV